MTVCINVVYRARAPRVAARILMAASAYQRSGIALKRYRHQQNQHQRNMAASNAASKATSVVSMARCARISGKTQTAPSRVWVISGSHQKQTMMTWLCATRTHTARASRSKMMCDRRVLTSLIKSARSVMVRCGVGML